MNKERAINILLDYAKNSRDVSYACDFDALTAAILFMEKYLKENKKDSKVEIKGLEFKLMKGL
jgi:ribosomal protein S15P/S13E